MPAKASGNAEFDARYASLNPAQKEAVDAIEGPVMVIAGPGTGKTTILTLRIANILRRTDTPANGILAITYTDAGVRAMREKLQSIIGDRAHDVRIHTFHSFASSIIAEYPDHFLHISGMKQVSDVEQESLIRSIISDPHFSAIRPAGKPDAYVPNILRGIDDSKREALTPDMVRAHVAAEIDRIKNDEASISTKGATKGKMKAEARDLIEKLERTALFADAYERYESAKREAKKLDFNDLIIELLLALRNDELLLRLIQERYLYIHVDEHQDTNDAQNFIVSLIAEFFETPNVFIVGDEKQAIYRFQGASVENFLLLQKQWPDMKLISLDTNYRSHQGILDASWGMIEKNYEGDEHRELRIRLSSGSGDEARPVEVVTGENVSAIELDLIRRLKHLALNEPERTAAIIVRRNRDLDRIIRLLEAHRIAVSSERSVDIFNHPVGRIFFDLIEYMADPSRLDLLAETVVSGLWGLSFDDSVEAIRLLKSLDRSKHQPGDVERAIPALASVRSLMAHDSSVGFLVDIAQASGYTSLVGKDPSYIHVWRGIVSLAESLARDGRVHDPVELMRSLLMYKVSAETKKVKVTVGAPDLSLRAMTAHGSKGLEFDYVFIPYATEEAWVGRARGASFVLPKKQTDTSDIRDVRRLFYVALTRARRHAVILTAREESDGKAIEPLRFIDELDPAHVSRVPLPRAGAEGIYPEGQEIGSDSALVDFAKRSLLENGLSVTALNHFLECPNKFLYQSILRIPQAPSPAAEKGTAMHETIAAVWNSDAVKAEDIEEIVKKEIRAFFERSLLSATEKASAEMSLIEDAPAVALALAPHFALRNGKNAVFTETWVESSYTGSHDGSPVEIPIHGKLDAVIDTGAEALIFDYKTRQAMSVNAIKGETQSSDGGYFRQLVYYRLLAGQDMRWKQRKISPSLVFVSPDAKGRCPIITVPIEEVDISMVKKHIDSLIASVWSGAIGTTGCGDPECEWCGLRKVTARKGR